MKFAAVVAVVVVVVEEALWLLPTSDKFKIIGEKNTPIIKV